jgi:amino acid adenylation domain-containing protein
MMTSEGPACADGLVTRASFAQERLWFLEALDPESALYNQLICYRIRGELDCGLLRQSIAEVVQRHSALRTNLIVANGLIFQSVSPIVPDIVMIDLPGKNNASPLEEAVSLMKQEARRPYDLASEPLVRPRLIRLGKDDLLLALVTHHTIMDGWSMGIMIREVAALYEALARGLCAKTALPAPGLQYEAYSSRQRQAYERGEYAGQLQYWTGRLSGDLPVLELPFDHPRPAMQTYDGRALTVVLPPHLTAALKNVGRTEKATLFMTLLAAFFTLLHRFSRQEDIIVGCPIAGRNQLDTEGMIGLCVNTLAIRAFPVPGQSFRELLRQVRSVTLEAYENQDLPFEKLVEKVSVQRSLNIPPVFQALFQLRNFPTGTSAINGCRIERYERDEVMVKTDLTLEITETAGGLSCSFEYPVALFDHDSVTRMAGYWQTLLTDIAANPDTPLSGLRILTEDETRDILEMGNGPGSRYPRKNIARLFEEKAREYPEAVAIRHGDERITYRQLDERSGRLAVRLREMHVRKGDIVALFMERSVGMVVSMLAVLKAGGAYLPFSPDEPESRIARMLESANARAALTDPAHVPLLEKYLPAVSVAGDDAGTGEAPAAGRPSCPEGEPGPGDPAYVMFTSGSTGTPKGVSVPHRGIARLVMDTDYIRIGPGDTLGHLSAPAFDFSTFEIWGALLNGATLVVIDKDVALSPPGLRAQIADCHIDILSMITPLFHAIVSEDPKTFCGLRHMLVGGDVMDPAHAMTFLKHCRTTRLTNAYGPTENTTFSTYYDVREEDCLKGTLPIGRPIAGDSLYILDDTAKPVPAGITGEIYVSGDGVSMGYLGSPGLSASKFLPDPFSPGRMMYRTGDLGRFQPDGNVRFFGRSDGQVKIRGFRVETGEVTAVLMSHPGVRQAVVRPYRGPGGILSLAGYLVGTDEGTQVPAEELRQYVAGRLPPHMVPASFTWIDAVPLTSRGKVDYAALPLPRPAEAGPAAGEMAADPMTSGMACIWRKVLNLPDMGLDDDFFNSGGHSLLAIRLIAAIEEAFGVRLPVSTIFSAPTIRQMTAAVRNREGASGLDILIPLNEGGDRPPLYCVHGVPGTLFEFSRFARNAGSDQPVYGIQSPGDDGNGQPPRRVEDMALEYIRILRKKQIRGPYYLLGYCAGGAIAYEMACRLEEEGERPGFLGIIDYAAPKQEPKNLFWSFCRYMGDNSGGAMIRADRFIHASAEDRVKSIRGLPRFILQKVRRFPREVVKRPGPPTPGPAPTDSAPEPADACTGVAVQGPPHAVPGYPDWIGRLPDPQRTTAMNNFDATEAYWPGKYQGKIILFMSRETARNSKKDGRFLQGYGWRKLTTGGVEIHILEGDHLSVLLGESVEQIARIIREEIDTATAHREGHER